MSTLYSWIPVFVFIAYIIYYQLINKRSFGPVSLIVFAYVVMAFLGGVLELIGFTLRAYELDLKAVLYFSACILIAFWGVSAFKDHEVRVIRIDNIKLFRAVEGFLIIASLGAFAFFLPYALRALSGDISSNRVSVVHEGVELAAMGGVNTFFSLSANMFALNILFALINLSPSIAIGRRSRQKVMLLLFGSLSYIIYVLAYVGRDGLVYWVMTFSVLFLIFRPFIHKESIDTYRKLGVSVLLVFSIPFALITVSRFSSGDAGVFLSLLQYGGVQLHQFSDHFITYADGQLGKMNFPVFYSIVSGILGTHDAAFDRFEWFKVYTDVGVLPWTFSTFIGSLLLDFGRWLTPILVLGLSLIARWSLAGVRRAGQITFSRLLIFMLCLQVVLYGVFYFRQYSANTYILALLALAVAFRLSYRRTLAAFVERVRQQG